MVLFVTVWFVCIVESAVVDEIKQDGASQACLPRYIGALTMSQ
jgi:hypothetical protein